MTIEHFHFGSPQSDTKYRIVVPSTKSAAAVMADHSLLPPLMCLDRMAIGDEASVDMEVVFENFDALSAVFNRALEESVSDTDRKDDFVVFVHDDIYLNDVLMFDKIRAVSDKFDVIGVCGGKTWNPKLVKNGKPIIWTTASTQGGGSGFMIHGMSSSWNPSIHDIDYRGRSLRAANYGGSPSRVLTIDGSFMCFGRKAIDSLRFDEQFEFHYYDMDVSMAAYAKKLVVGTAPILLTHNSLGESVFQPSYLKMQEKFLAKWFDKKQN